MKKTAKVRQSFKDCADWCTRRIVSTRVGRYISKNPWLTIALSCMGGDFCYLGFALHSAQGVSAIKLAGAFCAFAGQTMLLAHGEDQAGRLAGEGGSAAQIILHMRKAAKRITKVATFGQTINKPIACAFGLLSMNGVALMTEAATRFSVSSISQELLGLAIVMGCGSYGAADLVRSQRTANVFLKAAPSILLGSWAGNILLGATTLNPFIVTATGLFAVANLAGWFTRIEKNPQPAIARSSHLKL